MHIGPLQCPGRVQSHGLFALLCFNTLHYRPQTKFGKVICLQVCVCPQGGVWSRGGVWFGEVSDLGGAWSGGWLVLGECLVRGVWSQGVAGGDPPGQLLLWALHIQAQIQGAPLDPRF